MTVGGAVFGISNTPVTPPITAARPPVAKSSLCVAPGSRKCTWVSMTPGRTWSPVQSRLRSALSLEKTADAGNAVADHGDVAHGRAIVIDDRSVPEEKIEMRSQGGFLE